MLFNSVTFLLFLAVVLPLYFLLEHRRQNQLLLVASYVFYGWWDWRFLSLLGLTTTLDFWMARLIHSAPGPARQRFLLSLSIGCNLLVLGFFKYCNFFIDSAIALSHAVGYDPHLPTLRIILPVGISFYTFQSISYVVDVYRKDLAAHRNFSEFALYVAFFPQLVAGPIERAKTLLHQVSSPRHVSRQHWRDAFMLMAVGYFKKLVIADTMAPIASRAFAADATVDGGMALVGGYAFALQIYGDFCGYTDIARGVAKLMGFELMENFRAPYLSSNITEFWRRWHISLSTWLRDYLYISLGGNRKGTVRTYANLMLTMLLGGLWHGASWNFVIWGGLHGVYLCLHKAFVGGRRTATRVKCAPSLVGRIAGIALTFHLVTLSWVFFRASDFPSAVRYLEGLGRWTEWPADLLPVLVAGGAMAVLDAMMTWSGDDLWLAKIPAPCRAFAWACVGLCVLGAAVAHSGTVTPFIYFQF